jgi:branched-chain amino acid transport system substrate-binding protein
MSTPATRSKGSTRKTFVRQMSVLAASTSAFSLNLPRTAFAASDVAVGAVWAHTGPAAGFARIALMVTQLFLEDFNKGPGIKSLGGAKLRFIDVDTQSNPDLAAQLTQRVISQGVSIVLGTGQSAAGSVVTEVCERQKTPVLLPLDIATNLTERGFKYTFRVCARADQYATECVRFLAVLQKMSPIHKVGIMHTDDVFGSSAGQVLNDQAKAQGYTVVDSVAYAMTTQDFTSALTKFRDAGVDVMLFASYPNDAIVLARQMKEVGFNPKAVLGAAGGQKNTTYAKALGPLADGVMAATGPLPDIKIKALQDFNARFVQKFGEPLDENGGYTLSTLITMVDALERARSTDRDKLRDAIAATNLKVGSSGVVTLPGVKFDASGQNHVELTIMQYKNGKQVTVYPRELAEGSVTFPRPPVV